MPCSFRLARGGGLGVSVGDGVALGTGVLVGVLVGDGSTGNTISRNSIHDNGPVSGQIGIDLLAAQEDAAFKGLYSEALGDAYAALGRVEEAAEAYQLALADTTQTVNRGIVQMKLVDLPEALPAADPAGGEAEQGDVVTPAEDAAPVDDVIEPDAEPVAEDEAGETE